MATASRAGVVGTDGVADMVNDALADARRSSPAEDAFALSILQHTDIGRPFGPARGDQPSALDDVLSSLSGAFGRARDRDVVLAGFAEIDVSTLYLGSSTGLRLSYAQPTAAVNLVGRTPDGSGSAWVGVPSIAPSFDDMEQEIWRRLDWAKNQIALEAGRYEVIIRPQARAT